MGMALRTKLMVAVYCAASSVMLVLNKGAVTLIPAPGLLLTMQLGATVFLALGLHLTGRVTLNLRPSKEVATAYSSVAIVFLITLYANIKILEHAGVNAFIIVRSCTPFAVCVLDFLFMGRKLPNMRSSFSICATAICCYCYISLKKDNGGTSEWGANSVFWCFAWYGLFVFDQVFIKAIVDKYPASGWERTLYQNFFAFVVAGVGLVFCPPATPLADRSTSLGWLVVAGSCVFGGLLSYAGLSLRGDVTATMFTVLGVGCKMLSILLNEAFLQPTNQPMRLVVIALAVAASALYQQAPKRPGRKAADEATNV
mmetsp:Transcript_9052/g.16947  ORF Transcript_9052/g.16947 Transcript_9052/m.16947 type:complete len:313 (+) Transcript_9052:253-1191(+)